MYTFPETVCLTDATFDQEAERKIIGHLIKTNYFNELSIQRRLACYAKASLAEKDLLILEFMKFFWQKESAKELFYVFRDFDVLFSTLEKKGHFVHQFEVFIFGWCLFWEIALKMKRTPDENDNYFKLWRMTSTSHDLGYPLELSNKLSTKFSKLYGSIGLKKLSTEYFNICNFYPANHEEYFFGKINFIESGSSENIDLRDFMISGFQHTLGLSLADAKQLQETLEKRFNHGYVSAIILCRVCLKHIIKIYKKFNNPLAITDINDLKKTAIAVALHNLPLTLKKYIRKINFHKNPFAYILFLVDNLQEWSREMRQSEKYPSYRLVDYNITNSNINLSYYLFHDKWTDRIKENLVEALEEKREKIKLLGKPKPNLGFKINVTFRNNVDFKLEPIKVEI